MKAYEEVAEFIARRGPREVAGFRPSAEARQRVAELLQREKTTGLTPEERRELDHYQHLELLMDSATARARQLPRSNRTPEAKRLLPVTSVVRMKKTMKYLFPAMLIAVGIVPTGFSQGHISFNNYAPSPVAPVTISAALGTRNPADGPAGAFVGSNYSVSIFLVNGTMNDQAAFDSLHPIWAADARFFGTTGVGPGHGFDGDGSGFFDGGTAELFPQTNVSVTLQVRAWFNGGGVIRVLSRPKPPVTMWASPICSHST